MTPEEAAALDVLFAAREERIAIRVAALLADRHAAAPSGPLMKTADVAEYLGIGEDTVLELAHSRIPYLDTGKGFRFRREDVDRYVAEEMTRTPTPLRRGA